MGLGTKIKDALTGEPHDTAYQDSQPPGAYPDEVPGRHGDGRKVVPPHGSAVPGAGKTEKAGMTGPTSTYDQQRYESGTGPMAPGTGPSALGSDPGHHKLHKTDDTRPFDESREYGRGNENYLNPTHEKATYDPSHKQQDSGIGLDRTHKNDPYWGDVNNGQRRHHGAAEGVAAGAGAAGAGYGAGRMGERDLPERTRHGHGTHGDKLGSRNDELQPSGEAVGGGVYNTVTGAGSSEQSGQHTGHHGHHGHHNQPGLESRTAGTAGTTGPTSGYSDTRYDPKHGAHDSIPSSRDDRAAAGVVGAGAGVGAGLAASDLSRRHHEKDLAEYNTPPNHHGRGTHEPGMPHSSMLDIDSGKNDSLPPHGSGITGNTRSGPETSQLGAGLGEKIHQTSGTSTFDNASRSGMGPAGGASKSEHGPQSGMAPMNESSGRGLGHQTNLGSADERSRFDNNQGSGMGPVAGNIGSSMGKDHFGPAHEGAKVMHTCHSCGADNDISHYFKKDAVYRIGS